MNQEIHRAFDRVKASDDLINRTLYNVAGRIQDNKARRYFLKPVLIPCSLVIMVISVFWGYGFYYTEAAVISIDINPSIELSINRLGRVLDEIPYGRDGEIILSSLSLKHMAYSQAVKTLLLCDPIQPYLEDGALVAVTLETDNVSKQQLLEKLRTCVNQTLTEHHVNVKAEYGCAEERDGEAAHHQGMSVGKYCAIQDILKEDISATLQEFKDLSMKEIKNHKGFCHHGHSHP